MNDVGCLLAASAAGTGIGVEFFVQWALILTLSILVLGLLTPLIQWAYRRRIMRLMGLNQLIPTPPLHDSGHGSWAELEDQSPATARLRSAASDGTTAKATLWSWASFVVTALLIYGLVVAHAGVLQMLEFAAWAGLASLPSALVNLSPEHQRRRAVPGAALCVALLLVAGWFGGEWSAFQRNAVVAVPVTALALVFLHHPGLRGLVVPVVLVAWMFAFFFIMPIYWTWSNMLTCTQDSTTPWWFTAGANLLILGGLWLTFSLLGRIASAIDRGVLDDRSFFALASAFIVASALVYTAMAGEVSVQAWHGLMPLAWCLGPVLVYRALRGRPDASPGVPLLVLRVFSKQRRHTRFLRRLQAQWRSLGAIQMAGGPDLVDTNIDLYECMKFLNGRLHDVFLESALEPEELAGRFNVSQSADGRFRVNEMFNMNHCWRENVEQLMLLSPVILLDVRGLTAEREGTRFEIGLLAQRDLMGRTVVLVDEAMSWELVQDGLSRHGVDHEAVTRVSADAPNAMNLLVEALLSVATDRSG